MTACRRAGVALSAVALVATAAAVLSPGAATAAGAPAAGAPAAGAPGVLLVHSVGSVFTPSVDVVYAAVAAGSPGSFTVAVDNTGTASSKYNIAVHGNGLLCPSGPCTEPAIAVKAGLTTVTAAATSQAGYTTAAVGAGKTASYSVQLTPAKDLVAGSSGSVEVDLHDSSGTLLDYAILDVEVRRTTGTANDDAFLTASGSGTIGGLSTDSGVNSINGASVKPGQTSRFTFKAENDSSTPTSLVLHSYPFGPCTASFSATVTVGTANITAQITGNGYHTAVLAHARAVNAIVVVKYLTTGTACGGPAFDLLTVGNGTTSQGVIADVNPAA